MSRCEGTKEKAMSSFTYIPYLMEVTLRDGSYVIDFPFTAWPSRG